MVRLDGTDADERRLAAADEIAGLFEGYLVGLLLNVLPDIVPPQGVSTVMVADVLEKARQVGDKTEAALTERLRRLNKPVEIRRFDAFSDAVPSIAAREARSADVFVDLRPDSKTLGKEGEQTVEAVLFGSGRHLLLIGDGHRLGQGFNQVVVAWNGSRESARGLAEALPYLHKADAVTVMVIDEGDAVEESALVGSEAVRHLGHHGIQARLSHVRTAGGDVGSVLVREAGRLRADLIVMGGYGHAHMREWLLGGVSHHLLHNAPVPLVIAH